MGLTIHYSLASDRTEIADVRRLVQEYRRLAQQLPFQEIGGIVEFEGEQCHYANRDDPDRWLKIQAGHHLEVNEGHYRVTPLHIIAFTAIPGEGSEPANVGLARYPDAIQIERGSRKHLLQTSLHGWRWGSFCKTQYASNQKCGGVANFVRCHLSIVGLLDAIRNRQLATVEVHDESGFWEHRDVRKLAEVVGEWNEMVAAVVGQLKDAAAGFQIQAPITEFANFEHLEAGGQDKLDKRDS